MAEIPALSRRDFLSTGAKLGAVVAAAPYDRLAAAVEREISKTLSGALTTVRITTANGTDTFDAGSVNILYE